MNTIVEQRAAACRKAAKLIKALARARAELSALPRDQRGLCRYGVDDLTAKLSWALIECGRPEEALAFALKIPKKTHSEDRYLCEGTALVDLGRYDAARVVLEKGLQKHREFVPIVVSLGNCYARLYRFEDALACCERAQQLAPREPKILFNKAGTLANLGMYEDARDIVAKLLAKRSHDPMCNSLMGHCLKEMGLSEDAVLFLKKAIANGDDDPLTYDNLYWCYRDMGLLNDAIALAQEGIRKHPAGYPDLYRDLAGGYLELDWVDDARQVLKKGLEIFPGNADLQEILDALDEDPEDDGGEEATEKPKPILVVVGDERQRNKRLL